MVQRSAAAHLVLSLVFGRFRIGNEIDALKKNPDVSPPWNPRL